MRTSAFTPTTMSPMDTVHSLFVYGTLMAPEVVSTLIGRVPEHIPSCLIPTSTGDEMNTYFYRRHPVQRHVYPALISIVGKSQEKQNVQQDIQLNTLVQGLLYQDITENEMKRLDWFEGVEYTKSLCQVRVLSDALVETTTTINTQVYMWTHPIELLDTSKDWSYEDFRLYHLKEYLEHTVIPCRHQMDDNNI